jgi:Flp pilus assembly pilin Flp
LRVWAAVIIVLLALTMVVGGQALTNWRCMAAAKKPQRCRSTLRRHRDESGRAGILVGLCAVALVHDPELDKSGL